MNKYKGFAQKSSAYEYGRQTFYEHDVETTLNQQDDVLSGHQNELIDGDDTRIKNHGNENTPSDLINSSGTDSKDTAQFNGNGTASESQHNEMGPSPNNMINGNDTTLKDESNGKVPSAGWKPVKHKQGMLKKVGKLYSHDEREWIKCRVDAEDGLPYSGKFNNGMMLMKLHGDGCLLTSSHKYIALVHIDRNDELDSAIDFNQAIKILLKNLQQVELIRDVDSAIAKEAKEKFEKCMTELSNNSFEVVENAGDLFQLSMILQQFKSDKKNLLEHINKNQYVSSQLKQTIDEYVKACANFEKRKGMLEFMKYFFIGPKHYRIDVLEETLKRGAAVHKQKALETCPAFMKNKLDSIPDSNVFFVISSDLKLFSDMHNTLDKETFEPVLSALADKYCETISKIQPNDSTKVTLLTNPIYFYLCKSLTDVVKEINARTKDQKYDVWYAFDEWNHSNFPWVSSLMDKCFERELKMLIDMLNHFEPGKPSALQKFEYECKIFRSISKSIQQQALPTEVQVWLCLLDDTIENVLHKDKNIDQLCSYLLALYKSCSESNLSTMDSMESLRVITHNTIKYLALGAPFFNSKHGLDREITLSQINIMKRATVGGQMSFLDYRDLVEVFGQYWKQRGEFADGITAKLPSEYFKNHVANIQNILLQCMRDALRKNVELAELISFCRAYEELLVDLLDVPLDWYVRLEQGETHDFVVKRELVELVKNNWQDSEHKCYRVTNIVKFTARLTSEEEEHPKHYILETVKNLLNSIYNMMMAGNWKGGARLTELEQISSASLMIASVRSCLIYLKEQPDNINFDKYLEENSKPFETLSAKCTSFEEFKKRTLMIKESFWYIRNQNAIGIDEA
ncbi:conserved hypothetical protein [Culex quinquefasciatus]|uniref:Uncharacterized protein n=1 Tax=Culex quinquefasciatus TaxID=7176 RepID=B0XLC2_CULQU|nr:conserved hypothetical protein [Culex quinquefasciatus]|eukprot:XP_001870444.1 conserved hypothetical protein [Culex quinquefasciatus]